MHDAISGLLEEDINKIDCLIKALKEIEKNVGSPQTSKRLNDAQKYIQEWLNKTDTSEPSEEEMQRFKIVSLIQKAFRIKEGIDSLSPNRKKELIVLGYFLQGKLSTKDEFNYVKKVLRSYLKIIEQYRSPMPPH